MTVHKFNLEGAPTMNHVALTDDEIRLLEFLMASLGHEKQFHSLCEGLHSKLAAFGLHRGRDVYHTRLNGRLCHVQNREPVADWMVGGGLILIAGHAS